MAQCASESRRCSLSVNRTEETFNSTFNQQPATSNQQPARNSLASFGGNGHNSLMFTHSSQRRRSFLKSSALFSAAAPFILPGRIWSADSKPNDRLTLGFIGLGTQGRGLMGGFLGRKDTQTVAVCDVDTNRREYAKKQVEDHYAKQTGSDYKGRCDPNPDQFAGGTGNQAWLDIPHRDPWKLV